MHRHRYAVWGSFAILGACILAGVLLTLPPGTPKTSVIMGTVLIQNSDARKQAPIPNVQIVARDAASTGATVSDASGFFKMRLQPAVRRGETVTLSFRRTGYHPLDLSQPAEGQIVLAYMAPVPANASPQAAAPETTLSEIRIRYSVNTYLDEDIGSIANPFEIVNTNGLPCNGHSACSPDGKWKAVQHSTTFDAGEGSVYRNVRVSCIAGPCSFTKIQSENFSEHGRIFSVSILNWSATTTFLVEAEVVQRKPASIVRQSYPVQFGQTLDFTLPSDAEGPSIEAEVNGQDVVFPLGPELILPWASCTAKTQQDSSALYTCELNDGYRFK